MAYIVLLLLVTGKDADFLEIRIKKVFQHGRPKGSGSTGYHQGGVGECGHYISPLCK